MIPFIKKTNRKIAKKVQRAFTIIELIVVVGIFGIIMTAALANQSELNSSLLISNLAYEIGLITRETQAYGIGVRALPGVATPVYYQGVFGMNITMDASGTADKIFIFKDINDDGRYTAGASPSELFSVYQFQNQRGSKITALCLSATDVACTRGIASSLNELNVMFKRPNPEASFNVIYESGGSLTKGLPGSAYIVVNTQVRKNCRAVLVKPTGQINVDSGKSAVPACVDLSTPTPPAPPSAPN